MCIIGVSALNSQLADVYHWRYSSQIGFPLSVYDHIF